MGDVKMMAMVGAFLGLRGAFLTILFGTLLGSIIGIGCVVVLYLIGWKRDLAVRAARRGLGKGNANSLRLAIASQYQFPSALPRHRRLFVVFVLPRLLQHLFCSSPFRVRPSQLYLAPDRCGPAPFAASPTLASPWPDLRGSLEGTEAAQFSLPRPTTICHPDRGGPIFSFAQRDLCAPCASPRRGILFRFSLLCESCVLCASLSLLFFSANLSVLCASLPELRRARILVRSSPLPSSALRLLTVNCQL